MAAALALLVVTTATGVAHAFNPNLQFNVTYNAIDPIIQYVPNVVVTNGKYNEQLWNFSFSDTPWSSYVPGMVGQGTPLATVTGNTEKPPTGALVEYAGVASYFYGTTENLRNCTVGVVVNTQVKCFTPQGDFLGASITSDSQPIARQSVSFLAIENVIVHLKAVVVTWAVETTATDMRSIARTESFTTNGAANPIYQYKGGWSIANTLGDNVGGQSPMAWDHIVGGNGASVTVAVPRNTSFFTIQGAVGPDQGRFYITTDPSFNLIDSNTYTTYNPWRSRATLYSTPLDPNVQYNITLNTMSDGKDVTGAPTQIRAQSMTFYSSTKPRPKPKKTPIGPIVGGVVGGVSALVLAGIAIFFLRKRRRRLNREDAATFVIDEEAASKTTPFPHQAPPAPAKSAVAGYTGHTDVGYAGHELYTPLLSSGGVTSPTDPHQSLPPGAYAPSGSGGSQGENAYLNPNHQSADFSSASSSTGVAAAAAAGAGAYGFSDEKRRLSSNADRSLGPGSPMSGTSSTVVASPPIVAMPTPTPAWPIMEEDAGTVPMGATLPPSYNPAWQQAHIEAGASSSVAHSGTDYLSPSTSHAPYDAPGGSGSSYTGGSASSHQPQPEFHTPSPGPTPISGPSAAGAAFPVDEKRRPIPAADEMIQPTPAVDEMIQPTPVVESTDAAGMEAARPQSMQSNPTSERRHSGNHPSPGRPMGPRTSKKMGQ